MKILEESFTKGGGGFVKVVPENSEDMWQLYNLLRADDHVEATTWRKVTREAAGGVGASESERVRVKLRLHVEDVDYDGDGEAIRWGALGDATRHDTTRHVFVERHGTGGGDVVT